ncbi:zinc ribbon domain-containing protein [Natronomonas halophila]|uniref:zinc ribbon domain-containing protein n=1 Tax=Natronomonas halophila TaxID=2747817 RepID=UPI0015B5F97A|nr:zinc ribbon domain-containing protein [Natronomonas halophila]QLD85155.1 zinc ribbon domain-containing protein [Natronomonas halophila]
MTNADPETTVYCRECGSEIRRAAEICPECGVRQRSPPSSPAVESLLDGRNPLIAAVLSAVFPGLGHIYAREIDMGFFFAVAFVLAVLSLTVFIGFVLVPAIWLYAMYDAAKSAERRDAELTGMPAPARP